MLIVLGFQRRVDRNRNDSGLDAAEEQRWKIDRIGETEQHALLGLETQAAQRQHASIDPLREIAIGVPTPIVDVGELFGSPSSQVTLEQVVCSVIAPRNIHPGWTRAAV